MKASIERLGEQLLFAPKKIHVIIFGSMWGISFVLNLLVTTDLFQENPFQFKNAYPFFLTVASTWAFIKILKRYKQPERLPSG